MQLLIRNTTELRQCVSVNGDLAYDQLKPHLRTAQDSLIRYVGRALLEEVAADNLTDKQTELLGYVQVPLANLALMKYVSSANVLVTDVGVMRTKTANTNDAFEWQVDRMLASLKQTAFDGIEALLRYLEDNLTDFSTYAQSREYDLLKNRLIQSAEVFNQYYEIGGSRLVFETLRAAMITSEIRLILPRLGDTLTDLLGSNLNDEQTAKLDAARRALVYATIARALRERLVSITESGVQVLAISQFATIRYQQAPDEKQLALVLKSFDDEAALTLNELNLLVHPPDSSAPAVSRVRGSKIISI